MKKLLIAFLPIIMASVVPSTIIAKDNDTFISETAYEACIEYGEEYGICPELLMAIIERESGGRADAENGGCCGLMQINPKWHSDRMKRLGVTDLLGECGNILVGTDYLAELFAEHQEAATVLMVYHGEKNAVQKAENGEISSYAQWILDRNMELERIHEKENVKMGELEKERIKAILSGMNDEELKAVASEIPSRIILPEISLRIEILEMKVDATKKAIMSSEKKEITLI